MHVIALATSNGQGLFSSNRIDTVFRKSGNDHFSIYWFCTDLFGKQVAFFPLILNWASLLRSNLYVVLLYTKYPLSNRLLKHLSRSTQKSHLLLALYLPPIPVVGNSGYSHSLKLRIVSANSLLLNWNMPINSSSA